MYLAEVIVGAYPATTIPGPGLFEIFGDLDLDGVTEDPIYRKE